MKNLQFATLFAVILISNSSYADYPVSVTGSSAMSYSSGFHAGFREGYARCGTSKTFELSHCECVVTGNGRGDIVKIFRYSDGSEERVVQRQNILLESTLGSCKYEAENCQ